MQNKRRMTGPIVNDHTTAVLPLDTWAFQSPALKKSGHRVDIGLLAEALIYYDRVIVIPGSHITHGWVQNSPPPIEHRTIDLQNRNRPPFLDFVEWFVVRGLYEDLLALLKDGSIGVYHYAFQTMPMFKNGVYSIWNMQDAEEQAGPTFERRILGHREMSSIIPKGRLREKLHKTLGPRVIEVHAVDFDRAVENARLDGTRAEPATIAVQAVVDEVFRLMGLNAPPVVTATASGPLEQVTLQWSIDFNLISQALGPQVPFTPPVVLSGLIQGNRLIWSSALLSCDLFLPSPVSRLVSAKLSEANDRRARHHDTMENLKLTVDFPDIRTLVNSGVLTFQDVLLIRAKAKRFRAWLQTQAERDRDALTAYHHEVIKETGLMHSAKRSLSLFGAVGGAAIGAVVASAATGSQDATTSGAVIGAGVVEGVKYVVDVAAKLDGNWSPVMFGDWARNYVENVEISPRKD